MRYMPALIGGVTCKPSATFSCDTNMVVYSTRSHFFQGIERHNLSFLIPGIVCIVEKKVQQYGTGKFRSTAKTSKTGIVVCFKPPEAFFLCLIFPGQCSRILSGKLIKSVEKTVGALNNFAFITLPQTGYG